MDFESDGELSDGLMVPIPTGTYHQLVESFPSSVPWYSSSGSDFNVDFGLTSDEGETFGLSVFLHDGDSVFRTYLEFPRSDSVREAGGMGGFARGLAANPAVRVVAPA